MDRERKRQEQELFRSVVDYYSTPESLEYYRDRARNQGFYSVERAMVERFMSPPATVLDVGCGAGREAFELTRMGYTVTGVDVTSALLEQAKAIATELGMDIEFRLGNGKSLDFPDGSFDYVLLITQMIHHVPLHANRVRLLREAGRVVKPGGRILLTYNDHDVAKDHKPWGAGWRSDADKADELAATYSILERGDQFSMDCQGKQSGVFGYGHQLTREEMEAEVLEAELEIVERADFHTIEGGEPDEFWKPTRVLVLKACTGPLEGRL
ncbi:MAG TPA: class I SAM-dependent methyltransferase [Armatimonadota bacterium]|nr:class I SAM-dependent methyltransferase [Armatimonadota bacterium]